MDSHEHDRSYENLVHKRLQAVSSFGWGVLEIGIDTNSLLNGELALLKLCAIMPDGLLIDSPLHDALPEPRELEPVFLPPLDHLDVFIGMPVDDSKQANEVARENEILKIFFGGETTAEYLILKIAEVVRIPGGGFALRESFIPPCISMSASPYLMRILRGLLELLSAKRNALAGDRRKDDRGTVDIKFLVLQTLNTFIPELTHALDITKVHPEAVYVTLARLAGQLATVAPELDPNDIPPYLHTDLTRTFSELDLKIRVPMGGVTAARSFSLFPPSQASFKPRRVASSSTSIQFTVFHPQEVVPAWWYTLLAYAYLPGFSKAVENDSKARLAAQPGEYKKILAESTRAITPGAEITVVPELADCIFNPPQIRFLWLEDWHRAEFRLQAKPDSQLLHAGREIPGHVSFYVGPILVAEVKMSVKICETQGEKLSERLDVRATAEPYERIFVSYSHQDIPIVDQLEKAYTVLGMEYLRDVRFLRSGEEWNKALLKKIEEANIFQLCWSQAAKRSPYVEQEWKHALKQNRSSFIRPVYWESPMPQPPSELASIHFAYFQLQT